MKYILFSSKIFNIYFSLNSVFSVIIFLEPPDFLDLNGLFKF